MPAPPEPHAPHRLVLFGDSITEQGVAPGGYVVRLAEHLRATHPAWDVVGAGVSGDTVADLLARVDRDVTSRQPALVVVYIGVNDVWRHFEWDDPGTPLDVYEARLRALVQHLAASGVALVLCTPGVIGERASGNPPDAMLDAVAAAVRRVAAEAGAPVADLRRAFAAHLAAHNPADAAEGVLTTDGVHLNSAGNRLVAETLLPVLQPLLGGVGAAAVAGSVAPGVG